MKMLILIAIVGYHSVALASSERLEMCTSENVKGTPAGKECRCRAVGRGPVCYEEGVGSFNMVKCGAYQANGALKLEVCMWAAWGECECFEIDGLPSTVGEFHD